MNSIKFSHDWNNKLTGPCKVFTTIRKYFMGKNDYYSSLVGQEFDMVLKKDTIGRAKLIDVSSRYFGEIPLGLLATDTGYSDIEAIIKLFGNFGIKDEDKVMILTFEKTVS